MNPRLGLLLLAAALVAAIAFAGPSVAAKSAGSPHRQTAVLRVGFPYSFSTLDPFRQSVASPVAALSLESLMTTGLDGKIKPNLAQSVSRPGKAVYVYHLRHGVKFWNGRALTAVDVANAMNYYRFPGGLTNTIYDIVKSVTARGRDTVVVTLKHPDARWASRSAASFGMGVFEKSFADAHPGTMGRPGVLTMGTGPWIPKSFDPTRGVEFDANSHWWGGKVPFSHISVRFFSDETSMAIALRAGEIDVAPGLNAPDAFAAASKAKVVTAPSCGLSWFSMNTRVAPWNDVHVRRAVAYALNRTDLIKASGNVGTPAYTLVLPVQLRQIATQAQIAALLRSIPTYPYSPAKARQELARSAYPNGFSAPFPVYQYGTAPNVIQAAAAQLKQVGINLQLTPMTLGEWVSQVIDPAQRPTSIGAGISFCSFPSDPAYWPGFFLGSSNLGRGKINTSNYAPADVDVLIKQATSLSNPAKRFALYGKLLKRLSDDVPFLPLFTNNVNAALSNKYAWPSFDAGWASRPWALEIKPR
jgi:peptide/nickel transport system substrate-binding protein